jgi:hypothetical protein
VTFSEAVTGFDASDVIMGGTAGATTKVVTGSGTTYNVAVGGMTGSGTVTATVPENAALSTVNAPSLASTSSDNSVTYLTCNNVSIPTGATVTTNTQFLVPINVDSTTGRNITAYDFTLTYNPAVVTPIGAETAGTLSNGWTITTNNSSGTLVVSGFNTGAVSGAGTLLNIRFISTGAIGTTSNLNLTNFTFNEGVPCVNVSNGNVAIISGTIGGRVTYANAAMSTPVPNTTLNASGSIPVSGSTNSNGDYSLSGFGTGAYTVTPSKTGQANGISNADATTVAQHVVGFVTLNSTQQMAADVSGNGTITFTVDFNSSLPRTGTITIGNQIFNVSQNPNEISPQRGFMDFNGDGRTDYVAIQNNNGAMLWHINQSLQGYTTVNFGAFDDIAIPELFDADLRNDIAVWRPSTGAWFVLNSGTGTVNGTSFGQAGDKPVAADYDRDGKTDIAVWRPSSGFYFRLNSSNGQFNAAQFGQNGDIPVQSSLIP